MLKRFNSLLIGLLLISCLVIIGAPEVKAFIIFPETAACNALPGVMGDLNRDGVINDFDQVIVDKIVAGQDIYNPCGDFDENAGIDATDSSNMQTLILDIQAGNVTPPAALLYDYSFYDPYNYPGCGRVLGDANGDGISNYQDTDIVREMIAGWIPTHLCGDLDKDGIVSPSDHHIVTAVAIGLGNQFTRYDKPIINLVGSNVINLQVFTPYTEPGATATDNQDGDLTAALITDNSAVNTSVTGTYQVTYNVTDSDGNNAIEVIRFINVQDTTKPVITLVGANPQFIIKGNPYTELGATAADNYDGNLTASIVINAAAVNTSVYGTYTVTYNVTDSSGNVANQVSRTVRVVGSGSSSGGGGSYADTTPPANCSVSINNNAEKTDSLNVVLTLNATDATKMMISNAADFSGAAYEDYAMSKGWALTGSVGTKTVYVKFADQAGNEATPVSDSIILETPNEPIINSELPEGEVLGAKYVDERELQLVQIYDDAHYIWPGDTNLLLGYMNANRDLALEQSMSLKYSAILGSNVKLALGGLEVFNTAAITNFLAYGTKTTLALGAGERAGVLNSYKAAFSKLPKSEEDWRDAIKIANGRWPSQKSAEAEKRANTNFKIVYERSANMTNANDNAAVTTMAYGLRPLPRNLNSEKSAIKIFKGVYGYYPVKATAWDVVRAIAYSGAKR